MTAAQNTHHTITCDSHFPPGNTTFRVNLKALVCICKSVYMSMVPKQQPEQQLCTHAKTIARSANPQHVEPSRCAPNRKSTCMLRTPNLSSQTTEPLQTVTIIASFGQASLPRKSERSRFTFQRPNDNAHTIVSLLHRVHTHARPSF